VARAIAHRPWGIARVLAALSLSSAVAFAAGCNDERKQECQKFLIAMSPVQSNTPTSDDVDHANDAVGAIQFQDQPLGVYAKNYRNTLTVLSGTLKLQSSAGPDGPPDGTSDVIKSNLKEARTDYDDIARYCSN
jgi:hypothetical protein